MMCDNSRIDFGPGVLFVFRYETLYHKYYDTEILNNVSHTSWKTEKYQVNFMILNHLKTRLLCNICSSGNINSSNALA